MLLLDGLVTAVHNKIENHDIDGAIRLMKKFRNQNDLGVKWNQFANTIISATGHGKCISDLRKI